MCTQNPEATSFFNFGFCTSMCRSSLDCLGLEEALDFAQGYRVYCRFVRIENDMDDDYVPACVASFRNETGSAPPGSDCSNNSDCQDGACLLAGDQGFCAPTCCSDAQCGGLPNTRCRPIAFGDHYEMRCVP